MNSVASNVRYLCLGSAWQLLTIAVIHISWHRLLAIWLLIGFVSSLEDLVATAPVACCHFWSSSPWGNRLSSAVWRCWLSRTCWLRHPLSWRTRFRGSVEFQPMNSRVRRWWIFWRFVFRWVSLLVLCSTTAMLWDFEGSAFNSYSFLIIWILNHCVVKIHVFMGIIRILWWDIKINVKYKEIQIGMHLPLSWSQNKIFYCLVLTILYVCI